MSKTFRIISPAGDVVKDGDDMVELVKFMRTRAPERCILIDLYSTIYAINVGMYRTAPVVLDRYNALNKKENTLDVNNLTSTVTYAGEPDQPNTLEVRPQDLEDLESQAHLEDTNET